MTQEHGSQRTRRTRRAVLAVAVVAALGLVVSAVIVWPAFSLQRRPFSAVQPSYHTWDEILSHSKPITVRTFSTGMARSELSGIMNLEHELAQGIEDEVIEYPVIVGLIEHQEFGSFLIDAGLDASYVDNPYGNMRGMMVKSKSWIFSQEPGTDAAAILDREGIQLQGVFLTHMHPDHTAGIVDLPKDIAYVAGEDEVYVNFRFFMHGDHLAGVDELLEIDFAEGVDLPPLGRGIDVFGDGSLWAISSSGHSKGHVLYLVNGADDQVLFTGDACNTQDQFETGVGPGTFSSDVEQAQAALERIIAFRQQYPQVKLVYGHDWPEQ